MRANPVFRLPAQRGLWPKRAPAATRTIDGVVFDSKGEAKRWQELQLLERAGAISDLRRQVKYPLVIEGRPVLIRSEGYPNGRAATYTADFVYVENGRRMVEEFKGFDDDRSRLRRAVVEAIYQFQIRVTR